MPGYTQSVVKNCILSIHANKYNICQLFSINSITIFHIRGLSFQEREARNMVPTLHCAKNILWMLRELDFPNHVVHLVIKYICSQLLWKNKKPHSQNSGLSHLSTPTSTSCNAIRPVQSSTMIWSCSSILMVIPCGSHIMVENLKMLCPPPKWTIPSISLMRSPWLSEFTMKKLDHLAEFSHWQNYPCNLNLSQAERPQVQSQGIFFFDLLKLRLYLFPGAGMSRNSPVWLGLF